MLFALNIAFIIKTIQLFGHQTILLAIG